MNHTKNVIVLVFLFGHLTGYIACLIVSAIADARQKGKVLKYNAPGSAQTEPMKDNMGSNIIAVTDKSFKRDVLDSFEPVLVEFWAPWCGPCRSLKPLLEEIAQEYKGRVTIAQVNTDEEVTVTSEHRIFAIPAFALYKDGKKVSQDVGIQQRMWFKTRLDSLFDHARS